MEQEDKRKGIVVDRYSIIIIMFIISIILFFILVKMDKTKIAALPLGVSVLLLIINTRQPGRLRKNEYVEEMYYKGENDCGLTKEPKKSIDGVYVNGMYYKTEDGTDIVIAKDGTVKPAGFGSALMNHLSCGGYHKYPLDDCWLIEE